MARLRGRSERSKRCVCAAPHGHWKSNSFIAALRANGMGAPFLIEGAVNGEVFARYVEKVLGPELKAGDIVVLDNVGAHKHKRAVALIKARGAGVLYLPAYSPDLNPIEMGFSKLKSQLRSRAARSYDALLKELADILPTFSASQCRNFFRHAQYASN
jgi:transposase